MTRRTDPANHVAYMLNRRGGLWLDCTKGEKNPQAKLTARQVLAIRRSKASSEKLASKYSVTTVCINGIRSGRTWRSVREGGK